MKLAVVEDDIRFARDLVQHLHAWQLKPDCFQDFSSFAACSSDYDVLILDVDLYGENAIEKLRTLYVPDLAVIFLTSCAVPDTLAVMKNAWGYVVKGDHLPVLRQLLKEIQASGKSAALVQLETLDGSFQADPKKIAGFLCDYTSVFALFPGSRPVRLKTRSLEALEKQLPDEFFRISRQMIINVRHIHEIHRQTLHITCTGGQNFAVSRRRWKPLLETITRFLGETL